MPSFDVVSEVDRMEVKNAVDQAQRELSSRFDFKGITATIERRRVPLTGRCWSRAVRWWVSDRPRVNLPFTTPIPTAPAVGLGVDWG